MCLKWAAQGANPLFFSLPFPVVVSSRFCLCVIPAAMIWSFLLPALLFSHLPLLEEHTVLFAHVKRSCWEVCWWLKLQSGVELQPACRRVSSLGSFRSIWGRDSTLKSSRLVSQKGRKRFVWVESRAFPVAVQSNPFGHKAWCLSLESSDKTSELLFYLLLKSSATLVIL